MLKPLLLPPPSFPSLPHLHPSPPSSVCLYLSLPFSAWLCHLSGPPGPPTSIHVEEITDTTASLSWRPGPDNHSPITAYTIQARTPFSLGWQAVTTGKLYPTSCGLVQSHVGPEVSGKWGGWGGGHSSFCRAREYIGDVIFTPAPNGTQL